MQLKLQRSQRDTGLVSTTVVFCLDARVEFSPQERDNIRKYKLHKQVIYNSEAATKHLAQAGINLATGSMLGSVKALTSVAFAALNLNISIESLQRGQHVECKSMDELLGAEDAILTACRNLRAFLETAATFDGREVLIDFSSDEPTVVAATSAPPPLPLGPPDTSGSSLPPTLPLPGLGVSGQPVPTGWPASEGSAAGDFASPSTKLLLRLQELFDRDPKTAFIWAGGIVLLVIVVLSIVF